MTTDMTEGDKRPYFLWDEDVTVDELRQTLRDGTPYQRQRLMGKMLREARDIDVWHVTTPSDVAALLPELRRRIGTRRWPFWKWLIDGWRSDGII